MDGDARHLYNRIRCMTSLDHRKDMCTVKLEHV